MKTYDDDKISSQKCEVAQWKNDKRKIYKESLQLYGLDEKATEKLMNQIVNFEELEFEKPLNITAWHMFKYDVFFWSVFSCIWTE